VRPASGSLLLLAPVVLAGLVVGAIRPSAAPAQDAPKPAGAEVAPDPLPRLRAIARMMVNIEARHRTEACELERVARLCEQEKHYDLLRQAIRTRHVEQADYEARMQAFAADLGPELYGRLRAALDAGPGQAPALRAIIPDPPPPPLPHEVEAWKESKRAAAEEQGEEGG